jgi:phytanoyl-CoA hydroxylase
VPIAKRFVRLPGGGTGFERLISPQDEAKAGESCKGEYIMAECEPGTPYYIPQVGSAVQLDFCSTSKFQQLGDLVLIHGSVLHKSERNTSPHTRFAYTFHMIESAPYAIYDEKNWLQPTASMPFSRIL